jgi:hypothetical protein
VPDTRTPGQIVQPYLLGLSGRSNEKTELLRGGDRGDHGGAFDRCDRIYYKRLPIVRKKIDANASFSIPAHQLDKKRCYRIASDGPFSS